jgi:hypothetical protein
MSLSYSEAEGIDADTDAPVGKLDVAVDAPNNDDAGASQFDVGRSVPVVDEEADVATSEVGLADGRSIDDEYESALGNDPTKIAVLLFIPLPVPSIGCVCEGGVPFADGSTIAAAVASARRLAAACAFFD